jgi:F-type H+-transporting ATPase subunit b
MELNWSTFVLEIINFLVLVWILKRFLYNPIKKTILQRKEAIQKDVKDADNKRKEATELKQQYENRLIEWEKEKEKQKTAFLKEMENERKKKIEDLKTTLKKEREENKAREKQQIAETVHEKEQKSIEHAMSLVSQLLAQFASSELENKIINLFIEKLKHLPKEKISSINEKIAEHKKALIQTAFALKKTQKNKLISAFEKILINKCTFSFKQNQELLAGIYAELGPLILHLNLRDELQFFNTKIFHE